MKFKELRDKLDKIVRDYPEYYECVVVVDQTDYSEVPPIKLALTTDNIIVICNQVIVEDGEIEL